MVDVVFQSLLDELSGCHSVEGFEAAMLHAVEQLGVAKFAYLGFADSISLHDPLLISTYPEEWTSHYLVSRYQCVDPVVMRANASSTPFMWGANADLRQMNDTQRRLFNEAGEFDIRLGFTVPIFDSRGLNATVTFATEENESQFRTFLSDRMHLMHLIGIYFNVYVRDRIRGNNNLENVVLSAREKECLIWAAQGKTQEDISEIIGISRRTVLFHIENAKRKIGVYSTVHAIALALRNGLITI